MGDDLPVVAELRAAGCVFAEDEARLLVAAAGSAAELGRMVEQRVSGVPLEHILGWVEFCGLPIMVTSGVFVPRQRTELLVREAIGVARPGAVVLDLCCGSGAIGVAIATAVEGIELHAADIEPAAVACAAGNVAMIGGQVYRGDLFDAVPVSLRGRIDIVAANVPYVPTDAVGSLPREARDHEPRMTLDGGSDGLDVLRRVVADVSRWLSPGGHLLVETSSGQAAGAADVFASGGLVARVVDSPELYATVVIGRMPESVGITSSGLSGPSSPG